MEITLEIRTKKAHFYLDEGLYRVVDNWRLSEKITQQCYLDALSQATYILFAFANFLISSVLKPTQKLQFD